MAVVLSQLSPALPLCHQRGAFLHWSAREVGARNLAKALSVPEVTGERGDEHKGDGWSLGAHQRLERQVFPSGQFDPGIRIELEIRPVCLPA